MENNSIFVNEFCAKKKVVPMPRSELPLLIFKGC